MSHCPSIPLKAPQLISKSDGGGVRGIVSLLVLERIMEEIARQENQLGRGSECQTRFPADYFDLAGGTSTGGYDIIYLESYDFIDVLMILKQDLYA
jgi:patatin-like phospholipase/acyl hydrolase